MRMEPLTSDESASMDAAKRLALLMARELGHQEIDPIALRLFLLAYWSRVSALAHTIHDSGDQQQPNPKSARPKDFLYWAVETFGPVALDRQERVARFVEEAIELAHAEKMSATMLAKITGRVYSRERGETFKEIGQAQATLETFAESIGLSADDEAQREFARVRRIPPEEWRRRHAAKVEIGIANVKEASPDGR